MASFRRTFRRLRKISASLTDSVSFLRAAAILDIDNSETELGKIAFNLETLLIFYKFGVSRLIVMLPSE